MEEGTRRYMKRLSRAMIRYRVAGAENALDDAQEFIEERFAGGSPEYRDVVAALGPPEAIAGAYRRGEGRDGPPSRPPRHPWSWAPGWKITCTGCGRTKNLDELPFTVRWGARSIHKYRLGICRTCRGLRFLRLWRVRSG